jgi:Flp pilus assembly pilin Flp
MEKITAASVKFSEHERGQALTEYALIFATVTIALFVAYHLMVSW